MPAHQLGRRFACANRFAKLYVKQNIVLLKSEQLTSQLFLWRLPDFQLDRVVPVSDATVYDVLVGYLVAHRLKGAQGHMHAHREVLGLLLPLRI